MDDYPRVDRCPIDIYVPSNMPYEYPFKLGKPSYASPRIRETCETFIMDSGIENDELTNEDVLDMAEKLDADMVVGKDYLHDQERTTESIHEFIELHDGHPCRATPMIPLQPPHHEHYHDVPRAGSYLLGGIKDLRGEEVVSVVRRFRKEVGYGPYVHLLGVGASPAIVQAVSNDPDLVQSLDCSTPEQCAINGKIFDMGLQQRPYQLPSGEGSAQARYGLAKHLALILNDAFAYHETGGSTQSSMEAFAQS